MSFVVRNCILSAGLLVALLCNLLILYRIYNINDQLDLNYHWMIVKKLRADEHQSRIERLERIVHEKEK
jgi:hypothetical protein